MVVDEGRGGAIAVAAIDWHLRLPGATADIWLAFTEWLEADPAHADAYDRLSRADALLGDALAPADWTDGIAAGTGPVAANDERPARRRFARWAGAAALVATVAGTTLLLPLGDRPANAARWVETPAGGRRVVTLADGSRIELNGATRLSIETGSTRLVTLERGEAVFHVRHDAARPFVVRSGALRLEDVGTVFNVARVGGHFGVQVADGAVVFHSAREPITLTAGAALSLAEGQAPQLSGVAPGDVGSWRQNRLVFRQTPVRLVADALERSTGTPVAVAPALAETPFTGSIAVRGEPATMVPRAAALIGARAVHGRTGWTLVGGDRADP